jgi:hypothetical protein
MPKNNFSFDTPINNGKTLKGMLTVSGIADGRNIEIEEVLYRDHKNRKSDVTYLIQEFAYDLYANLEEMALNHTAIEEPDYTLEKQDY